VTAKPGELLARWGRADGEGPDVCFAWGDWCEKGDSFLLWAMLSGPRYRPTMDGFRGEQPFIEELKALGYDITTLRFSVQK
jgi:hypothetical protein